ncbi:MAG: 30S ribosome-binding factor RbfA [Gracilibacteraceae bacterium]|jgi:ribosome-binding factor A|nr:30S ribosome-binding factor RbfA [Gracilibacteraceae bacterium]
MSKHRVFRLAEHIKTEVARIISEEVKDPRLGFVTLTGVKTDKSLSLARVYVSVLGEEAAVAESMKALESAAGFIRGELGKTMTAHYVPELRFVYDASIRQGARISAILREVGAAGTGEPPAEDGINGENR